MTFEFLRLAQQAQLAQTGEKYVALNKTTTLGQLRLQVYIHVFRFIKIYLTLHTFHLFKPAEPAEPISKIQKSSPR